MRHSSFKPEARWDRPPVSIDTGDPASSCSQINQNIEVLVFFKQAKIMPRLFIWNNKTYKIKKVNYGWQERRGREIISCFSVAVGIDLYQISFNNTSYCWKIDKIIGC